MLELAFHYAVVVGASMFRLMAGPICARGFGLSFAEAVPLTALGMTLTSYLLSSIDGPLRERGIRFFAGRFVKDGEPVLHPRLRSFWERWGIVGLAAITPFLLSPPGGVLVAMLMGVPRPLVVRHMMWSAALWSTIYAALVYGGAEALGFPVPR